MAVLPDISVHHQVPQVLLSVDLDSLSDDELVEGAHQMLRVGMVGHIAAGRFFIAMKERFRGRFLEIVKMKFEQSPDVIEAMMAIAREFPDPNTWASLPSCWTTLERLTRIPQDLRERWRCSGIIHPRLTHEEAKELVRRAKLGNLDDDGGDQGGDRDDGHSSDQDGDRGGDDRGDAKQDGDARSKPGTDIQLTDQVGGAGADSNEVERLKAHIEELEAYIERLEAEAEHSEGENELLKRRNAELEAMTGFDVGRNQRSLLSHAIETAQEAIETKDDSNERRRLQMNVGTYILDIVRSAERDGLDVERFDLAYRPKLEELPKDEERDSASLDAEATQLQ